MADFLEFTVDKFIFKVKKGLLYHPQECWLSIEGEEGTIGITDYFQQHAGDIAYLDLPDEGIKLTAGENFAVMETIKSTTDLISPATGFVTAVNEETADEAEITNQDPYGEGWLLKIKITEPPSNLLCAEEYFALMQEKIKREL